MARKYDMTKQVVLPFLEQFQEVRIPTTGYQGSKAKLVDWIWGNIKDLDFLTVLDAFGGTGVVGYYLKQKDKQVFYNDYLKSNYFIGLALIENNAVRLSEMKLRNSSQKTQNITTVRLSPKLSRIFTTQMKKTNGWIQWFRISKGWRIFISRH